MKKVFTLIALVAAACSNEPSSRRALTAYGFTDIQLTGYQLFGCSEDDIYHTGFVARNPQGNIVEGVVCCGALKNCTVRF